MPLLADDAPGDPRRLGVPGGRVSQSPRGLGRRALRQGGAEGRLRPARDRAGLAEQGGGTVGPEVNARDPEAVLREIGAWFDPEEDFHPAPGDRHGHARLHLVPPESRQQDDPRRLSLAAGASPGRRSPRTEMPDLRGLHPAIRGQRLLAGSLLAVAVRGDGGARRAGTPALRGGPAACRSSGACRSSPRSVPMSGCRTGPTCSGASSRASTRPGTCSSATRGWPAPRRCTGAPWGSTPPGSRATRTRCTVGGDAAAGGSALGGIRAGEVAARLVPSRRHRTHHRDHGAAGCNGSRASAGDAGHYVGSCNGAAGVGRCHEVYRVGKHARVSGFGKLHAAPRAP